jgi:hypothetical protein
MSKTATTLDLSSIPSIELPPFPELTPEELRRRGEAIDRMRANRDKIGPIGISTSDLIRQVRDELEDGIDE